MSLLTQESMADFMTVQAAGVPLHQFGGPHAKVSSSLWEQGDGGFALDGTDFHTVEACLSGSHRGRHNFETGDKLSDFKDRPGGLSYLGPNRNLELEYQGQAKFHQLWINHSLFRDVISSVAKGDPDRILTLGFTGVFDATISRAMSTILTESKAPSAGGQLMIDAAAQQIAVAVVRRNLEQLSKPQNIRVLSDDELRRAIDFIEDQIEENEGLGALADSVGMSMYVFAHAFKKTTGVAPHQFLIKRRLTRAQDLLAGSSDAISDIAYACGFSSQAHMTNIFAKHVGISPGKYRKARLQ